MLAKTIDTNALFDFTIYFGLVVGVILLGVVVVSYLRRRMTTTTGLPQQDFTLDSIRELRDRGELTIAEYEALREKVVKGTKS